MQQPRPRLSALTRRLQRLLDPHGTVTDAYRSVWKQVDAGEEIDTETYEALRSALNDSPFPTPFPSKADLRGCFFAQGGEAQSDPAWVEAANRVRWAATERSSMTQVSMPSCAKIQSSAVPIGGMV